MESNAAPLRSGRGQLMRWDIGHDRRVARLKAVFNVRHGARITANRLTHELCPMLLMNVPTAKIWSAIRFHKSLSGRQTLQRAMHHQNVNIRRDARKDALNLGHTTLLKWVLKM